VAVGAGDDGTVEGVVVEALAVGSETAGGGKRGTAGMFGICIPLSAPGGVPLGVGALEASGEAASTAFLLLP
jgi:hypothetical protein